MAYETSLEDHRHSRRRLGISAYHLLSLESRDMEVSCRLWLCDYLLEDLEVRSWVVTY